MKEQHYIQKFIKTEDDLPEEGRLVLHENFDGTVRYSQYDSRFKHEWIEIVKWYLQEVEQSKGLTDAEEKLFILDLLRSNRSVKVDGKRFYPEESVINIIKQVQSFGIEKLSN